MPLLWIYPKEPGCTPQAYLPRKSEDKNFKKKGLRHPFCCPECELGETPS